MQATATYDPTKRYCRVSEWSVATQSRSCLFSGPHEHGPECRRAMVLADHVETGEKHELDGRVFASADEARAAMFEAGLLVEYRPVRG